MKGVGRDTTEILHEDLVSLVLVLQQNVTSHAAVVCHQKVMLTVFAERVTLAKDVTGAAMGGLASHSLRVGLAGRATVTVTVV